MKKHSLIRTIYLYLFTLVGLTLLVIAGVRFLDMGLKAFVFTKAEQEERLYHAKPPMPASMATERMEETTKDGAELSEQEKTELRRIIANYKTWQEQADEVDPITANRHRDASINLSMILVGLPLYFYHWRIIKKETKNTNH